MVLSPKDVSKPTSIRAESSSCCHNRVLAQFIWRGVETCSISFQLAPSDGRYAQIEKYLVIESW